MKSRNLCKPISETSLALRKQEAQERNEQFEIGAYRLKEIAAYNVGQCLSSESDIEQLISICPGH